MTCRKALVPLRTLEPEVAQPEGMQQPAPAPSQPSGVFLVAREAGFSIVSETRLEDPVSVTLFREGWTPCAGTARTRVVLEASNAAVDDDARKQVEALVVGGCAMSPNAYSSFALPAGSSVQAIVDAPPMDVAPTPGVKRELDALNRVFAACPDQPPPVSRLDRFIARSDPALQPTLRAAESHPSAGGGKAELLVTVGARQIFLVSSQNESRFLEVDPAGSVRIHPLVEFGR